MFLGPHQINEGENLCTILASTICRIMSSKDNTIDACDRLKGTFVNLVNSSIFHEQGLHPLSCLKIYRCILLPKTLYGYEILSNISRGFLFIECRV